MFGNFLEETATGTGATLALAGATTGNIQFQEKFADGDLVAYVVDDSGGTIKVGGVGTYVSATDDITRNDTWSWNGTTSDDNPSTNITLSGGTHTVRCDALGKHVTSGYQDSIAQSGRVFTPHNLSYERNDGAPGNEFAAAADVLTLITATFNYPVKINECGVEITTASASNNIRVGIYSIESDSSVGGLIYDSGSISTTSTGQVFSTTGLPIILGAGSYYIGTVSDNTVVRGYGPRTGVTSVSGTHDGRQGTINPDAHEDQNRYAVTYGALPSTVSSPTGATDLASIQAIFK